jgi:peptidoglycan-associated lipoprotein
LPIRFVLVSGGLVVTREDPGRTPEDELYEASVFSVTRRGALSFDGRKNVSGGFACRGPERRRKEVIVMNACNMKTLAILATTTLVIATGCQSTGNSSTTTTGKAPISADPEIAASGKAPAPAEPEMQTVYFEYDRWELGEAARQKLRSNAKQLAASAELDLVTVAGHCDDRGSGEYNLALGDRRAAAVKRYLVDMGVPAARVRTQSFGEARPAVRGEGDAVWSRNRRAELSLGTEQASR